MSHLYNPVSLFFYRCVHNEPFFSLHPFLRWQNINMEERRECADFVFSPSCPWLRFPPTSPLWSSHSLETVPQDPRQCILERRAPVRNGAHPNRHFTGHGRLACSQVPAAVLRGLHPWESFHHSLSAIHKQSSHIRTHLLLLHFYIYISIFHTASFIILTFHTDSGASSLCAQRTMWAPVPSEQCVQVTACLACHCRA